LIADDHEGTRGILRVLLERHAGWEICGEASTSSEALEKSLELKPDVLVKDWVMPGMDQTALTREISKALPNTAIVIFSFYEMPELEIAAKAAGVHRVATKNLASLIAAIEDVLRASTNKKTAAPEATAQSYPDVPKDKVD
jgi:DNA-binding NarL/FixJ family response regulator